MIRELRWFGATSLVLLSACTQEKTERRASPSSDPGPWETQGPRPEGPTHEDQDFKLTASRLAVCGSEATLSPPVGHQRVSVPIELESSSERPLSVGPLHFSLQDENGHRYRATLAGCRPTLKQQTLAKDQKLSAEIAFDVPRDAGPYDLYFEPFVVGRKPISAAVKVPR